jgi:8-oxo-dGTP pyrophosphatase MutT (NUDIX family)
MSRDIDAVAKVAVKCGGTMLFLQKSSKEWELPGGHLVTGEKFTKGAKREVHEETGINLTRLKVIVKQKNFMLFSAAVKVRNVTLSDEHIDYGWFSIKAAKKLKVTEATVLNWKRIISQF